MTNLLTRNSPREFTTPVPSKDEMREIYQAALRAPDHAWLRPSRFIEVTGAGLDKLSKIFTEFAMNELQDVTPLQIEKYKSSGERFRRMRHGLKCRWRPPWARGYAGEVSP